MIPVPTQGVKMAEIASEAWLSDSAPTTFIPRESATSPMAPNTTTPARIACFLAVTAMSQALAGSIEGSVSGSVFTAGGAGGAMSCLSRCSRTHRLRFARVFRKDFASR